MVVSGVSGYRDITKARSCTDEFLQLLRHKDYEVLASKYRIEDGGSFEKLKKRLGNITNIKINGVSQSFPKMVGSGDLIIAYIIKNNSGKKYWGVFGVNIEREEGFRIEAKIVNFVIASASDSLGDREYIKVNLRSLP